MHNFPGLDDSLVHQEMPTLFDTHSQPHPPIFFSISRSATAVILYVQVAMPSRIVH